MINYGTDYELCKTGTDHCSYCLVFSWRGAEADADRKRQIHSADSRRREHRTVRYLGTGYQ